MVKRKSNLKRLQESAIIAAVSQEDAMINELEHGSGDIHSLVAYMSYPDIIPRGTKISEIKSKYHNARQDAKGIEFSINYGGDASTIAKNKGIPMKEAQEIYDNFMKGFPKLKKYQDYCRAEVERTGYIILDNITLRRWHMEDAEYMFEIHKKMNRTGFWEYYEHLKKSDPQSETVKEVRYYQKRKAEVGKKSINYRIQGRGSGCFKYASILLFNWIVEHNYQNTVKMCVPVHDEFNCEAPIELVDEVSKAIVDCMVKGGKPFCPGVYLGADMTVANHWIHG